MTEPGWKDNTQGHGEAYKSATADRSPLIGDNPPNDGHEYECQCARCGSSMAFEPCDNCGGDGLTHHDCGEDTCCCRYPEDNVVCDICGGKSTFAICLSSPEWCEAHPLSGREKIQRHEIEWFRI